MFIEGTSDSVKYSRLLPDCPRIVDPANPANNVYLSGIGPSPYGARGEGKWEKIAAKISSLDLTIPAERLMRRV